MPKLLGRVVVHPEVDTSCRDRSGLPVRLSSLLNPVGLVVALGAFALPDPAHAQIRESWLDGRMSEWYAAAARRAPGTWGIAIADQSGQVLWSVNEDQPLIPASTVKVLTTGFARSVLGGEARRPTRVVGKGHVDPATGEWVGRWGLELNGDPTLERAGAPGPTLYELAQQLKAAGVRRLSGPLTVTSANGSTATSYPSVWHPRHRGRLFAPLVGPVTLNENVVWFTVAPGAKIGHRARIVGLEPSGIGGLVTMRAVTRSGRRTRLSLQQRKDGGWVITGRIGIRGGARRLSAVAHNPKVVLNAVWAQALQRAGITWIKRGFPTAKALPEARVLAEVTSPPLDSVASEVNRRSLNIGAELMLRWAGGDGAPTRLMEHVNQVTGDPAGSYLVDGSGLSLADRVKPVTFTSYLARFPTTPAGRNFPQLLPANGTGTLRRLNSGLPGSGVVRAKTGTLANVSTVVGYLGRPGGVLLVSLMYNGGVPAQARQEQWRLFRMLGADGVIIPSDTFQPGQEAQFGGEEEPAADEAEAEADAESAPATAPEWWPAAPPAAH
jgi:D-alanyl-D-alanine carboxypeptidase/D-alanyl-D-alanine-endopeptidase (penicillin-binding protein 4)